MTLFVGARMVNVETGRAVAYSYARPYRQISSPGNLRCPSGLKAFDESLAVASQEIADHLSPKVDVYDVALETDVDEVDPGVSKIVKGYLQEGFKFAETNNLEAASEQWEEALAESGGASAAAYWNLAAYKWYAGDMDSAQDYFRRAIRTGGPGWLDADKRETYALFKSEYRRIRLGR
jgi:tetratricopeptide (TPR) repeat protein